jgi:translation initiation factor 2 subunit 1
MIQKPQRFQGIVSDEWINALVEVAEKNIVQKEFELRAKFFIKTNASDGINKIKDVLKKIEKMKIGVHYIASPEYLLKYPTKDPKRGTKDFMSKLEKLNSESEGCDIRFELIQE